MFKSNTHLINISRVVKNPGFVQCLKDRGISLDHTEELKYHGSDRGVLPGTSLFQVSTPFDSLSNPQPS